MIGRGTLPWGTTHLAWIYEVSARACEKPHKLCVSMKPQQEWVGPRSEKVRLCIWHNELMSTYSQLHGPSTVSLYLCALTAFLYYHMPPTKYPLSNWMTVELRNRFSCHNGLNVHLYILAISVSRCFSDYTRELSAVKLTTCIYIVTAMIHAILWCIESCVCYNDKYDRQNLLWLWNSTNRCCENRAPSLSQSCTKISAALEVSSRPAQKFQLL